MIPCPICNKLIRPNQNNDPKGDKLTQYLCTPHLDISTLINTNTVFLLTLNIPKTSSSPNIKVSGINIYFNNSSFQEHFIIDINHLPSYISHIKELVKFHAFI